MTPEILAELLRARADKRAAVLVTDLRSGQGQLVYPFETDETSELLESARAALSEDRPRIIEATASELFLNVFNPPLRMAIIGAVHIAQPLSAMAALAGYDVSVIDPRTAFASAARFPRTGLSHDWPDAALTAFQLDRRCAVVALTHDPKLDDAGLDVALRSPCFYIGALGSRKTHKGRLTRLAAMGHDEAALARIHGPIGLAIGARSPAEIAIAIMAEVTNSLRAGSAA